MKMLFSTYGNVSPQNLLTLDNRRASRLLCSGFNYTIDDVIEKLRSNSDLLFNFLSAVFEIEYALRVCHADMLTV